MRYFVKLSYNGTKFHGWQIQSNAHSIQEDLNNAFSILIGEKIKLYGSGRTDTGVHAKEMYAHFDTSNLINCNILVNKLNLFLCRDIVIFSIFNVDEKFHARFDAISRTYEYIISNYKNPFNYNFAYNYRGFLDFDLMNTASELLILNKDFASFSKYSLSKSTICNVTYARWYNDGKDWIFKIKSNRFLRNMVRSIVGTLILVGQRKISVDDFRNIIEKKDRSYAGPSAPAHALYLLKIDYPNNINEK
ncbi:MAG: tRNA pseudouridine(38-40) synthase TruA [Flavobacteriales bacterium TMED288]|nr:tRNA pseudouridine(38-40) synthase TruA [Flavobacteriales bacterium]RPG53787.1 MAG: tRNA pseudouridine(38-40) synthase TruA [Flavobacteriales bacterium TMED288]